MYLATLYEHSDSAFAGYYASDSINDIVDKALSYIKENTSTGRVDRVLNAEDEHIQPKDISSMGEYLLHSGTTYFFLIISDNDEFKRL